MPAIAENRSKTIDVCPIPADGGRVNIRALARQYETQGFPVPATRESLIERYRVDPDQRDIDMYALGVPIVGAIVSAGMQRRVERPPFGLVHQLNTGEIVPVQFISHLDPFGQVRDKMMFTLEQESAAYFAPDHLAEIYSRNPHAKRNHEVFHILSGNGEREVNDGIITATKIIPAFLRLIPELYTTQFRQQSSAAFATQLASDNYPFLSQIAMAHATTFGRLTEMVGGGRDRRPINPGTCEYVPNEHLASGWKLQFNEKTQKAFEQRYNGWLLDEVKGRRPRIGCIAMFSDALPNIWKWNLDIAKDVIYPRI